LSASAGYGFSPTVEFGSILGFTLTSETGQAPRRHHHICGNAVLSKPRKPLTASGSKTAGQDACTQDLRLHFFLNSVVYCASCKVGIANTR
jgi:hypothetical protein